MREEHVRGTPDLSIVIPHFGEVGPTSSLVDSLVTGPGESIEVIVVDDASPVGFPDRDDCTIIRRTRNGGYGCACNSGLAAARGRWVLFLNSDACTTRHDVLRLLRVAEKYAPAVVSPRVSHEGARVAVARRRPRPIHHIVEWLAPLARFHDTMWYRRICGEDVVANEADSVAFTDWVEGVCYMAPRRDLRAVGGFDRLYFMNCEEVDLHLTLHQERGLPVIVVPSVIVDHVGGGSSAPGSRAGWVTDARFKFAHKWGGEYRLLVGLVAATGINWVWNLGRWVRGVDVEPARAASMQLQLIRHGWSVRAVEGRG